MYLNATENTKHSALLHSLGDAMNMNNAECDTCSATMHSRYYCCVAEQYGGKHTAALPWRRIEYLY